MSYQDLKDKLDHFRCEECDGFGELDESDDDETVETCTACKGTGLSPGVILSLNVEYRDSE